jgi:hypothetical protein
MDLIGFIANNTTWIQGEMAKVLDQAHEDPTLTPPDRLKIEFLIEFFLTKAKLGVPMQFLMYYPCIPANCKICILSRKVEPGTRVWLDTFLAKTYDLTIEKPFSDLWDYIKPGLQTEILDRLAKCLEVIDAVERRLQSGSN